MPRFVMLGTDKQTVVNNIMAESFEAAEEFTGPGHIVVETEATGRAVIGYQWDGTTFSPAPETPTE